MWNRLGLLRCAFTAVFLMPFFVTAYPREWQSASLPQKGTPSAPWMPAPSKHQVTKDETERRPETETVRVTCHPDYMEIEIDADLLELGFPVDVEDVRLGKSEQSGEACKAVYTEADKYRIAAALTDCGSERAITEDYLIYSNTLEYAPSPSPDGVVRTQAASFPVQCYYRRKFDLSSFPVMPTWIPFMSTRADEGQLDFSLQLMTDDWAFKRASNQYHLGDVINIEASIKPLSHNPMRVFVDHCVATLTPDASSVPRYAFIEHDGCMMDSFMTGSTSRFLPRVQHEKLHIQLDAFRFHEEERAELYITCLLRVEPVGAEPMSRACSFIDNRWQSADDEDWLCDGCVLKGGPAQSVPSNQQSSSTFQSSAARHHGSSEVSYHPGQLKPRSGASSGKNLVESSKGWEKEERIGPIPVLKKPLSAPEAVQGPPPVLAGELSSRLLLGETKMAAPAKLRPLTNNGLPKEFKPETEMAAPAKLGLRGYAPVTDRRLPEEFKPVYEDQPVLPVLKSPDSNINQFFDVWRKRASPKDLAEMMQLLQKSSSSAAISVDAITDAPVTKVTSLPAEGPSTTPAALKATPEFEFKGLAKNDTMADPKLDFAMVSSTEALELSSDEEEDDL
ncbi:zona pellucida sperm-binding protein 3-like isoform X2 [Clupea harengus]|uniref:Zona pellucida sperm-binding protein 3 n=1 Tax=Clupea harengus TaxID=7950 RepID=A0A6P8EQ57_CLUHA|nr:zona pellucida sperm-binding protein 3-like isoform X2 [Clupea harengus]